MFDEILVIGAKREGETTIEGWCNIVRVAFEFNGEG
jgi:hypothetical protein